MSELEHHRRMLAYEIEANRRVLASMGSVSEERRIAPEFAKARSIMAHNQFARRIWLSRLGSVAKPDWKPFPDWTLDEIQTQMVELDRLWANYLETLREGELSRDTHYSALDGSQFSSSIGEILTHVHNHSTYHRGQIASLITACGGERAATDYIVVTRKPRG